MGLLFTLDGALFVVIGLVVLIILSPQPALVRPVDDLALRFKDTWSSWRLSSSGMAC